MSYIGSIREAGGSLGARGATKEEEYIRKQQKEQLDLLRSQLEADITQRQKEVENHNKTLQQHQQRLAEIDGSNRAGK